MLKVYSTLALKEKDQDFNEGRNKFVGEAHGDKLLLLCGSACRVRDPKVWPFCEDSYSKNVTFYCFGQNSLHSDVCLLIKTCSNF